MSNELLSFEKQIKSGAYRDFYLVYNRKSTDEPNSQKNSLSFQKITALKYAKEYRLPIAPLTIKSFCTDGIVSEKHSGFKESAEMNFKENGIVQYKIDRPKFHSLVAYMNAKLFKGIIVLCWDRISRNKADNTIIDKLIKQGVDIRFVQAHYDKTSAGELHRDIEGTFAEHHSRVTSEKVRLATMVSRDKGICTYRAPIGYLNIGSMNNKPFDNERAPIIKNLFEKYATDEWSLPDLARWANKQGLTTVPMRRPRTTEERLAEDSDEEPTLERVSRLITPNHIYKWFANPFYTGKILKTDGTYIKSQSHEALISDKLFTEVQTILKKKQVSIFYKQKIDLPYRGMARCSLCNRSYTPYIKKGIQYFGSRCCYGCNNQMRSINIIFLEKHIGNLIANLYFTEQEIIQIDRGSSTDRINLEENKLKKMEEHERIQKKIREDLMYLKTNKLELLKIGVYTPEDFLNEEKHLNMQLIQLQNKEHISDTLISNTFEEFKKLSELLKNLSLYYPFAKPHEKEGIAKIIFSELAISENTFKYRCKNGFIMFEKRFLALGDPMAWFSELIKYSDQISISIREISLIINSIP